MKRLSFFIVPLVLLLALAPLPSAASGGGDGGESERVDSAADSTKYGTASKFLASHFQSGNATSQEIRTAIKSLTARINNTRDWNNLCEKIAATKYTIAFIRVRQDKIDELIAEAEGGAKYLEQLKAQNAQISINPYANSTTGEKVAQEAVGFAATSLLVKNPSRFLGPIAAGIGVAGDVGEAAWRAKIRSDVGDDLDEFIKANRNNVIGLYEVHTALSKDLNVELARLAALTERQTECAALTTERNELSNKLYHALAKETRGRGASRAAVLNRAMDTAGDIKMQLEQGVTRSSGQPVRPPSGVTLSN